MKPDQLAAWRQLVDTLALTLVEQSETDPNDVARVVALDARAERLGQHIDRLEMEVSP